MDPYLVSVVAGVVTALLTAVGVLWKELRKWQRMYLNEQSRRRENDREHYQTSKMFLAALEQQRKRSSVPPPSSR